MLRRQVIAAVLLTGMMVESERAEACSCLNGSGIGTSVPAEGDTNVPLNVVLWVIAYGQIELRDDQGKVVDSAFKPVATGDVCNYGTEIRPARPLLPNTTYTLVDPNLLEQQGEAGDSVSPGTAAVTFTTGASALPTNDAAAPATTFAAVSTPGISNSCVDGVNHACVWTQAQGLVDVRLMSGEVEVERYLNKSRPERIVELGNPGQVDCVEIRTRDLAGQFSEPAKHCFDDTQLPPLTMGDVPAGFADCPSIAAAVAASEDLTPPDDEATTDSGEAPIDDTNTGDGVTTEGEVMTASDISSASSPEAETETPERKRAVTASDDAAGCSVRLQSSRSGAGLSGTLALLTAAAAVFIRRRYS